MFLVLQKNGPCDIITLLMVTYQNNTLLPTTSRMHLTGPISTPSDGRILRVGWCFGLAQSPFF